MIHPPSYLINSHMIHYILTFCIACHIEYHILQHIMLHNAHIISLTFLFSLFRVSLAKRTIPCPASLYILTTPLPFGKHGICLHLNITSGQQYPICSRHLFHFANSALHVLQRNLLFGYGLMKVSGSTVSNCLYTRHDSKWLIHSSSSAYTS